MQFQHYIAVWICSLPRCIDPICTLYTYALHFTLHITFTPGTENWSKWAQRSAQLREEAILLCPRSQVAHPVHHGGCSRCCGIGQIQLHPSNTGPVCTAVVGVLHLPTAGQQTRLCTWSSDQQHQHHDQHSCCNSHCSSAIHEYDIPCSVFRLCENG